MTEALKRLLQLGRDGSDFACGFADGLSSVRYIVRPESVEHLLPKRPTQRSDVRARLRVRRSFEAAMRDMTANG